jgi:hypothetical protein
MQARITTPVRVKPRIKGSELFEFSSVDSFVAVGEDVGSKKPVKNKLTVISHLS